jgi:hypothetical protein
MFDVYRGDALASPPFSTRSRPIRDTSCVILGGRASASNALSLVGVEERKRAVGPLDLEGSTLSIAAIGEIAQ